MHYILTPFGSAGDVYPFLWIGKILRSQGHRVSILVPDKFAAGARAAGLEVQLVGPEDVFREAIDNPDLWKPHKGPFVVFDYAGRALLPYFEAIRALASTGPATLIGSGLALGARLARERLGLPLVTVHLQPSVFLSAHDFPQFGPGMGWLRSLPLGLRRFLLSLPNPVEWRCRRAIRAACRAEGVCPPKRLFSDWWNSPDLVLALFPEWFGAPQPDWPAHTRCIGFPLHDEPAPIAPELEAFFHDGPPPILVTPGSAMAHGRRFFATALEVCTRLNQRALFVTRHPEQLPVNLPRTIRHCDYLPFSAAMPRCRAVIHHGGVGTLSQALAAGIPQLIIPMAFDQPDNAARLRRLGVGASLYPHQFSPEHGAATLRALLGSEPVTRACRAIAGRIQGEDAAGRLLEALRPPFDRFRRAKLTAGT